jgi:hypothetical protein
VDGESAPQKVTLAAAPPQTAPVRVLVDGGRHVIALSKEADAERGYTASDRLDPTSVIALWQQGDAEPGYIAASKDAIVARFSTPGPAESERPDPVPVDIIAPPQPAVAGATVDGESAPQTVPLGAAPPQTEPVRVAVDGGRHVIALWKEGDAEHGYRLMARAFNSIDDSPRGAPVAVSPVGADVAGPLNAVRLDSHRVIAAFAASTADGAFAAYAVPLTVP